MISIERVRFQQSLDALGQQGRQDFVDFLRDYHGEYLQLRVAGTGRMQQRGNIPDRNVAMSRMTDMLGMKGLIAKSRKVRIKHKDGTVRSGVFQEAEEFSDAARLKAGDRRPEDQGAGRSPGGGKRHDPYRRGLPRRRSRTTCGRTEADVRLGLQHHKQELSQMLDSLKRTESVAHWNSASYDWMRDSLKNVIAGIKAIENKYTDADIPLQQEDAAKIEALYRQMRLAAAKYVAEHRNPGYSRGITRKTCAETLAAK